MPIQRAPALVSPLEDNDYWIDLLATQMNLSPVEACDLLIREERLNRILNASQTLKPGDQELISLRYGAGLGNQEIAETMQISSNAVAVRLHRALGRLREAVLDETDREK